MPSTSSCRCDARVYLHAHCFCTAYNCSGKAVSRSTYQNHRKASEEWNPNDHRDPEPPTSHCHDEETLAQEHSLDSDYDGACNIFDSFVESDDESQSQNSNDEESRTSKATQTDNDEWDQKIVEAILNALPLKQQQGDSISSFEGWLKWAKDFVITDDNMKDIWPTTWSETESILKKVGYESPKHYYICMSNQHPREWDIMESSSDKCRHCGELGSIDYYYMGLYSKVRRWYSNPVMCNNMLDHWKERDHWFYTYERGQTNGWPVKKELWDGARFSQYSYFFDREKQWLLPAFCPHCKDVNQTTVIPTSEISSCDVLQDGTVSIVCPRCHNRFKHLPKWARGDPRNIIYIAHWDGFSPFETSGGHSTGVIDVKIANMSKAKRNHADQVFVVGFVPCFKTPDETPEFLDPFLTPLVDEIVTGYINGMNIYYATDIQDFGVQKGNALIRHLIILWTGDHPGQCEVAKVKRTGKKPCRRCLVCGTQLEHGSPQYYYGNCRYHARHTPAKRTMEGSLPSMKLADEEEGAAWKKVSRDSGFTGLSKLVTLYNLYGFDVLLDTPIDLMHNLPMNPVKKSLLRLLSSDNINKDIIESRLLAFPWTPEMRASRYPSGITSRLGYWKAEDYQKFAFPASEVILSDLMPDDEFHCWKLLVQMVQMVFHICRTHGWQERDIEVFRKLAWRHNIMVEEKFGIEACVITEHNLIHVSEDITRFSSPDNYWVFDLERAVRRYVNQTTNHRNIEKTYSDNEVRREVLQNLDVVRKHSNILTQKEVDLAINNKQVSSLQKGIALITHSNNDANASSKIQDGILIGSTKNKNRVISEKEREEIWQDIRSRCEDADHSTLAHVTQLGRSFLKPGKHTSGPHELYRQGENVVCCLNDEEQIGRIMAILLVTISNVHTVASFHIFSEIQFYQHVIEDGEVKYHHGTNSKYFCLTSTIKMVNITHVLRKVIMYPDQSCPGQHILIDFQMPSLSPHKQSVTVPVYPEKNDMVHVLGEDDVKWIGRIVSVQCDDKTVGIIFYKEHPRWPGAKKFIKENSTIHRVHWNSITDILTGNWLENGIWELVEGDTP